MTGVVPAFIGMDVGGTFNGSVAIFRGSPGCGKVDAELILCEAAVVKAETFKGRQFIAEVVLCAARWYLMFPIGYRDLELMLLDRGLAVYNTTIPLDPGICC